jgi:hypothetical protein
MTGASLPYSIGFARALIHSLSFNVLHPRITVSLHRSPSPFVRVLARQLT